MNERSALPDTGQFAAALDWWKMAGVDCDFVDDARAWLAEPKPEKGAAPQAEASQEPRKSPVEEIPAQLPSFGGNEENWPTELDAFRAWWLEEPALEAGGTGPRVPPRGTARPELMVLVAEPEDTDTDFLLSGPHGRLLASFLSAAGIAPDKVYLASALPRAVAMPDWRGLAAAGLGKVLEHHAKLVAPQRILVFGRNILPLIGHPSAQDSAVLRQFNHEGRSVPLMGSRGLSELARSAPARERLWRRWLDWTDGTKTAQDG